MDSQGYAIVPNLNPYQMNDIIIDPKGASDGVDLRTTRQKGATGRSYRSGRAMVCPCSDVNRRAESAMGQPQSNAVSGEIPIPLPELPNLRHSYNYPNTLANFAVFPPLNFWAFVMLSTILFVLSKGKFSACNN
ncbi:hypothetical protein FE394_13840 [Xenorhabdus sp. Reich]|uniref:Uncharacterized protein n=1 Tax=Xenorhabdus littoralis TaxID=2582835 RepID=A0ABU4SNT9_9GAMM|nr:hypothetical protein [Xenorhabdus sp. Reich]